MNSCASTLRSAVPALVLVVLTACGGGVGGVEPAPTPEFYFVASTPPANSIAAVLDQIVTVTFNKPVDPDTVAADTLTVTSATASKLPGTTILEDDGEGRTLRWTPTMFLSSGTAHTCRMLGTLRSEDQDTVGGPNFFNFRTIQGEPPPLLPDPRQLRPALDTLVNGRQEHTATLLADGRVLVAGGFTQGFNITDEAEVFQTSTEQFTELPARMVQARSNHTATRLSNGKVLLAGGWIQVGLGDQLATTATAELFDPGSNTFTPVGDLTKARVDHAAILLPDGKVLITGGSRLEGTFLRDFDDVELFDPNTLTFSAHPETMTHTRATHGMVDMGNGKVVIAGGSDADLGTEWYDESLDAFLDLGQASGDEVRFGVAMASFASGGVVIAGGDDQGTVLYVWPNSGQILNTGSGLNRPRAYATATRIAADRMLVVGGVDWSRNGFLEASVDLVVEGGIGGSRTFGTEVRFPHGMAHHTATALSDGNILYCGGLHEDGNEDNRDGAFIFEIGP